MIEVRIQVAKDSPYASQSRVGPYKTHILLKASLLDKST